MRWVVGAAHRACVAQAALRKDWAAVEKSADNYLHFIPESYYTFFRRGEARFHLGRLTEARADLELFLAKEKDSWLRPDATALLAELTKAGH